MINLDNLSYKIDLEYFCNRKMDGIKVHASLFEECQKRTYPVEFFTKGIENFALSTFASCFGINFSYSREIKKNMMSIENDYNYAACYIEGDDLILILKTRKLLGYCNREDCLYYIYFIFKVKNFREDRLLCESTGRFEDVFNEHFLEISEKKYEIYIKNQDVGEKWERPGKYSLVIFNPENSFGSSTKAAR